MKNLRKAIKEIQIEIKNNINNLNNGGCATFASLFASRLKELKIDYHVVILDQDLIPSDFAKYDNLEEKNHVALFIKGIGIFDGYKFIYPSQIKRDYSYARKFSNRQISTKKLKHYASSKFCWNPTYDVSQNRKLKKIISKFNAGTDLL